jgi:uncharacterized RDD family membrane protein YckC
MIAFLFPAVQLFGKKKPVATPTETLLPANATMEDVASSMLGAGLAKTLIILLALIVLVVFAFWAWSQVRGD